MAYKIGAKFAGTAEILRRIDPSLYEDAVKGSLKTAVTQSFATAQKASPFATGRTKAALSMEIDAAELPKFGAVRLGPVYNGGFRYAWALNASKKRPYTRLRPPRAGKPTRLWFRKIGKQLKGKFRSEMRTIIKLVQLKWRTP